MEYQNKQVLIIGLARSGLGAARLLLHHGAMVTICDSKKEETIKADVLNEAAELPVRLLFGTTPDEELLARYDFMILSPGVPTDLPFVLKARDLGLTIWGEVELAYRFCKAPIIGITGTNGKTTTTALTGEIMKAAYPGTEVVGNIGIAFALRAEVPTENDYVVAELSSFQMETIEAFHPHISAVLNITPDHLNRHHTMQAYMEAKQNIYRNQTEEDFCVLNFDDPECLRMAGELKDRLHSPQIIGFSRKTRPEGGIWTEDGQIISEIGGERRSIVRIDEMQIFGAHNEENMLAAIACCLCAGLDPETRKGRERAALLDELLDDPSVEFAPAGRAESAKYAQLFRYLKRSGTPIPLHDVWIAATALVRDAAVCSNDGHFRHVPLLRLAGA